MKQKKSKRWPWRNISIIFISLIIGGCVAAFGGVCVFFGSLIIAIGLSVTALITSPEVDDEK